MSVLCEYHDGEFLSTYRYTAEKCEDYNDGRIQELYNDC
jgi:hypothetical protein